ncbi:MAG TPA: FAD-dependent oxidoreductase, partial [Polyangia bacterium]
WSDDVVLFTTAPLAPDVQRAFDGRHVHVVHTPVTAAEADNGGVRLLLEGAPPMYRDAVFVAGGQSQKANLLARLGCKFTDNGMVDCGRHQSTCVPGLYVAGDAAANIQFAIIAAAEGASAAFAINREILREDFGVA